MTTETKATTNRLADLIARYVFHSFDSAVDQAKRLAAKGGEYPDRETDLGGVCEPALAALIQQCLKKNGRQEVADEAVASFDDIANDLESISGKPQHLDPRISVVRRALSAAPEPQPTDQDGRIASAMAADLGRIAEALGLDPDDGGAAPMLAEIGRLRQQQPALDLTLGEEEATALRDGWLGTDEEASSIRLFIDHGHSGYGLYVGLAEYPEDGCDQLAAFPAPSPRPTVPEGWMRDADQVSSLVWHLENIAWRPDDSGGWECVDQASAMAAEALRALLLAAATNPQSAVPLTAQEALDAAEAVRVFYCRSRPALEESLRAIAAMALADQRGDKQ